jgi:hypothetical protein
MRLSLSLCLLLCSPLLAQGVDANAADLNLSREALQKRFQEQVPAPPCEKGSVVPAK